MKKILVLVFLLCLFPLSCLAKPIIKCDKQTFDPLTSFIFFDEQSLKRVNPQNFLQTFRENQIDNK